MRKNKNLERDDASTKRHFVQNDRPRRHNRSAKQCLVWPGIGLMPVAAPTGVIWK